MDLSIRKDEKNVNDEQFENNNNTENNGILVVRNDNNVKGQQLHTPINWYTKPIRPIATKWGMISNFSSGLETRVEAARSLGIPKSTVAYWLNNQEDILNLIKKKYLQSTPPNSPASSPKLSSPNLDIKRNNRFFGIDYRRAGSSNRPSNYQQRQQKIRAERFKRSVPQWPTVKGFSSLSQLPSIEQMQSRQKLWSHKADRPNFTNGSGSLLSSGLSFSFGGEQQIVKKEPGEDASSSEPPMFQLQIEAARWNRMIYQAEYLSKLQDSVLSSSKFINLDETITNGERFIEWLRECNNSNIPCKEIEQIVNFINSSKKRH